MLHLALLIDLGAHLLEGEEVGRLAPFGIGVGGLDFVVLLVAIHPHALLAVELNT